MVCTWGCREQVIDGTVYCKTQKHFYMEPQTSYAIPDEDGTMRVFASMQNPGGVNAAVSRVLGLPLNKVQVVARRTGGGFGGKLTRHTPHAAAAAVAAHALRRPVRVTLSRNDDMKTTGGREDVLAKYQVRPTRALLGVPFGCVGRGVWLGTWRCLMVVVVALVGAGCLRRHGQVGRGSGVSTTQRRL